MIPGKLLESQRRKEFECMKSAKKESGVGKINTEKRRRRGGETMKSKA